MTCTKSMLDTPFRPENKDIPHPPPNPFYNKWDSNYRTTNRFSEHDNRNAIQNYGVYFGNGRTTRLLGRRLDSNDQYLHYTRPDFLSHQTFRPVHIPRISLNAATYLGLPPEEPTVHRRYPKTYKQALSGSIPLSTTTTDEFKPPNVPYKTSTQVLGDSQQPLPKHNSWQYSYRPLHRVYPPYNSKQLSNIPFNNYGAAFQLPDETE